MSKIITILIIFLTLACVPEGPINSPTKAGPPGDQAVHDKVPTGGVCGGIAGIQCGDGEYCHFEPGVCLEVSDAAGICQPIPQACTQVYQPVCGCGGGTFSNACMAAASGNSVAHPGACESR